MPHSKRQAKNAAKIIKIAAKKLIFVEISAKNKQKNRPNKP